MLRPSEEKRLSDWLLTTGKVDREALLACYEAQRQQSGSDRKSLEEIVVERGLVSLDELETIFTTTGKQIQWCPRCSLEVLAQGAAPDARNVCGRCGGVLELVQAPPGLAVSEPCPTMLLPDHAAEDHGDERRGALADPRFRIGRYVILEELGRGGMGVVYRCHDPRLQRDVAIKMISDTVAAGDELLARFELEALTTARMQHPGIVAIHEVGEQDGSPYLVMDLVLGETFEALLQRRQLTPHRISEIVRDVALALHHAHGVGTVHRDVKCENVMLDEQGCPHVLDFGLARDTSARQQLTQTGQIMGTPAFMAPEQVEGQELGAWTDVYALGAMLYYALVGHPPFQAEDTVHLFRMILMTEPPSLRSQRASLPADLETICLKCMEKVPDDRYSTAAEVADDLQRFLDGLTVQARPMARSVKAVRWVWRNRALSATLAVAVLAVVGALASSLHTKRQAAQQAVRREERASLEALTKLRADVAAVLDRIRSGERLVDPNDRRIERTRLLRHQDPEAVGLLTSELDAISARLADSHSLSQGQELLLQFLCDTLADLGIRDGAVASLGTYLRTEQALPAKARNQLRAVPAGKALCLLGGPEADRLLIESRDSFGGNALFWRQVEPLYGRTGVEPELEAETAESYVNRGLIRAHKGDFDGAIADVTRAIEMDPSFAPAWLNRGAMRSKNGDLDGAIADLTRSIELNPNYSPAWFNRGTMYFVKGDLDGALADFTRSLEIDPNSAHALNSQGIARHAKGDLDLAIADFTRALEIVPHFSAAWFNRGFTRFAKRDFDGAIADFTRAMELDPNDAKTWSYRGLALKGKGDLDGAISDYSRAMELDPEDVKHWNRRGDVRKAQGDLDGAIADYTRAIGLDSKSVVARFNLGRVRAAMRDFDGAIAEYTHALEIESNNVKVWYNRGNSRLAMGDLGGAIDDYTRAIELDSQFVDAWINRGDAAQRKGDNTRAVADFTRALEIDPDHPKAWFNRGNALAEMGEIEAAISDYTRALEISPGHAETWVKRGIARGRLGDTTGAVADWQRFLDLAPNHPNAAAVRAQLKKLRQEQGKAGAGSGS